MEHISRGQKEDKYFTLNFKRLPDHLYSWRHRYLWHDESVIVSEFQFRLRKPFRVDRKIAVNNGYKGRCYELIKYRIEIIEVRNKKGMLTGYYCNINTPPKIDSKDGNIVNYSVTDLCLDVWVFPDMKYLILDEDEFAYALKKGWINKEEGKQARAAVNKIINWIRSGDFPPPIIRGS